MLARVVGFTIVSIYEAGGLPTFCTIVSHMERGSVPLKSTFPVKHSTCPSQHERAIHPLPVGKRTGNGLSIRSLKV
jgi:hypothetical protein